MFPWVSSPVAFSFWSWSKSLQSVPVIAGKNSSFAAKVYNLQCHFLIYSVICFALCSSSTHPGLVSSYLFLLLMLLIMTTMARRAGISFPARHPFFCVFMPLYLYDQCRTPNANDKCAILRLYIALWQHVTRLIVAALFVSLPCLPTLPLDTHTYFNSARCASRAICDNKTSGTWWL